MSDVYFFCDESFDPSGPTPSVFLVGGVAAELDVWRKVERGWRAKSSRVKITRFHAVDLNAHKGEFDGWTRQRAKRYSSDLIKALVRQERRLHVVSVGVLGRDYERIINEDGRRRLGNPYILCFKQCVALLGEELHREENNWAIEARVHVVLEDNRYAKEARAVFYNMKASPSWRAAYRLGECTSGGKGVIPLQVADLVVYETFRLIHERHFGLNRVRIPLTKMFPSNGFLGFYYEEEVLERMKKTAEADRSAPNGCIIIQIPQYTSDEAKTT